MKNKIIIGTVSALAVLGAGFTVLAQVAPGSPEAAAVQQEQDMATYFPESVTHHAKLGSVSGPDNPNFTYWNINGVTTHYRSVPFVLGTTTVCAIQSPAATSSLTFFSAAVSSSTADQTVFTLASSTTAYATTTAFQQVTLGANLDGSFMWVPTPSVSTPLTATSTGIIPPSKWIVLGVSGILSLTNTSQAGRCIAEFTQF